jgi:hypothetical protein
VKGGEWGVGKGKRAQDHELYKNNKGLGSSSPPNKLDKKNDPQKKKRNSNHD